jgi:hypothetical protein
VLSSAATLVLLGAAASEGLGGRSTGEDARAPDDPIRAPNAAT